MIWSRPHPRRYDRVLAAGAITFVGFGAPLPATQSVDEYMCAGFVATIVGTSKDDTLTGTPGPDVIVGLKGHDIINGGAGDDVICGGRDGDVIHGGAGDDALYGQRNGGGPYEDRLDGGPGDDLLDGGRGVWHEDIADYNAVQSPIVASSRNHSIVGAESGHDTVRSIYIIWGTPFDDRITGFWVVHAGNGDDIVRAVGEAWGAGGDDLLVGRNLEEPYLGSILHGGVGADELRGRRGYDLLLGETGDDMLRGGAGTDTGDGGDDTDTCVSIEVPTSCELAP